MKVRGKTFIDWSRYFYYDETSPSKLRWAIQRTRGKPSYVFIQVGDTAGYINTGYWKVKIDSVAYLVHRIIYELHFPLSEEQRVDHENGNKLDNSISNLRETSDAVNSRNKKLPRTNTSGKIGVSLMNNQESGRSYWKVNWCNLEGVRMAKCFSIQNLGNTEAFEAACRYRDEQIRNMNLVGAGYTKRHGT